MKELQYLATAKFDDFHEPPRSGFTQRSVEVEAKGLGMGGRLALGEGAAAVLTDAQRLEEILAHLSETCWAHTKVPGSCDELGTDSWLEFEGWFRYGAALSDLGLHDQGVFAYASLEDGSCPRGEPCANTRLLLCGSKQHVRGHRDHPPTRMGSGSDWLHALAAELVQRERRGDFTRPATLLSTSQDDQSFAATSAYDMVSHYYWSQGYLNGHARVLCNFPPAGALSHRLIVATPLYVEAGRQPVPTQQATSARANRRAWWRRLLPLER